MKKSLLLLFLFVSLGAKVSAQDCPCKEELSGIQQFMEKHYVGYKDKVNAATRSEYKKMKKRLLKLAKAPSASDQCLLLISNYLDWFRDSHIQIGQTFDPLKIDSTVIARRETQQLSEQRLHSLRSSTSIEGIYNFGLDSTYRVAVIAEKNGAYDYKGVILSSKLSFWKRGQIKFLMKKINDSLYKGILYMRNHLPKVNWFAIGADNIGGEWQREGTERNPLDKNPELLGSRRLNDQTLYLRIGSFNGAYGKKIDSLVKSRKEELANLPYLILDLRGNGGGSDFSYRPLTPYFYTGPVRTIGVDVFATDSTIAGWKQILQDEDLPETSKAGIRSTIRKMEENKGALVNMFEDRVDSSLTPLSNPKKIVVLIDRGCGSTTEQFLLMAKQSSKVVIAGEASEGVLDYSNMRQTRFPCLPYNLFYSTTRSRRIDVGQGIDNVGIQPDVKLAPGTDWITESLHVLQNDK